MTNLPGAKSDDIIRVSRQNNSGTYAYFRETVVGKKNDFKSGSMDMNGSKDVVELVGKTAGAIGYSGLGYATAGGQDRQGLAQEGRARRSPPASPPCSTRATPSPARCSCTPRASPRRQARKYLDWILSDAGQKIVEQTGYVPLPKK